MTDIEEENLRSNLDALVDLTAQFSLEQLIETFVRNVRMVFPNRSILLITEHGPRPMNQLALTSSNLQGTVDNMLHKVYTNQLSTTPNPALQPATIVNRDPTSSWIQIPLQSHIGVIGFLQVAGEHTQYSIALAETHIRVFINQINILSKNERDALTGLFNRQAFDERMKKLIERKEEKRKDDLPTSSIFAIVDIDHFKYINDSFGHLYGDEVLILFARILRDSLRDADWIFRYGGEEFAILIRDCELETGAAILERLRKKVEAFVFPQLKGVNCSIGATELDKSQPLGINIERADIALYYAKEHGRNQLRFYETLLTEGKLEQKQVVPGDIEIF